MILSFSVNGQGWSSLSNVENAQPLDVEEDKLPHLYGFPWYQWAKDFFDSTNTMNFLCAANQISKSSTMIRKCIHWATEKSLWSELWDTTPTQFWYFYPDKGTATREFKTKWEKEFLPKDKDDPVYGWKAFYEYQKIHRIEFKSGVIVYFLSYEQQLTNIQSSSVYAMFCDEEAPSGVYDEVAPRVWATGGYFHMCFTATLGQETWRLVIEERGAKESFPDAFKRQVSMYDCVEYMDGSPSPWTLEKIKKIESSCRTEAEKLRRVHGRFILSSNNLYSAFERNRHVGKAINQPGWRVFAGVYQNAVVLVKVNAAYNKAEVFDGWLSDDKDLSALKVYIKYRSLTIGHSLTYSFADKKKSKDFCQIAMSGGSAFGVVKRPKDNGEKLINSLFEAKIIQITSKKCLEPLVQQLSTVRRDHEELEGFDFVGALITVLSNIPWNFSEIFNPKVRKKDPYKHMCKRERWYKGIDRDDINTYDYENQLEEINEVNEFYEG